MKVLRRHNDTCIVVVNIVSVGDHVAAELASQRFVNEGQQAFRNQFIVQLTLAYLFMRRAGERYFEDP